MMAILCKVIAALALLGGVISGIAIGGGFLLFLIQVATGFTVFVLFFAVGEILSKLEEEAARTSAIYQMLQETKQGKEAPGEEEFIVSNSRAVLQAAPGQSWTCRECGMKNAKEDLFCKGCGKYR